MYLYKPLLCWLQQQIAKKGGKKPTRIESNVLYEVAMCPRPSQHSAMVCMAECVTAVE